MAPSGVAVPQKFLQSECRGKIYYKLSGMNKYTVVFTYSMGAVGGLFRDIRILNDSVVFRGNEEGQARVGYVSSSDFGYKCRD